MRMRVWFLSSVLGLVVWSASAEITRPSVSSPGQAHSTSNAAAARQTKGGQASASPTPADATAQPTADERPVAEMALITVLDTSPSVGDRLEEIKLRAKELVQAAPAEASVGVVGINWEATKKLVGNRTEAEGFIDALIIGGRYTDLNRGNDAALSLLQESGAKRAAVVFLTDGEISVPRSFKNKESFAQILAREYAPRPEVKVFVINVKGKAINESLPPNVKIVSLASWTEAREFIKDGLMPQIKEQLAASGSPKPTASEQPVAAAAASGSYLLLAAAALCLVFVAATIFIVKRKRGAAEEARMSVERPANAMERSDLEAASRAEAGPEPVLLLSVSSRSEDGGEGPVRRAFLRSGERLTIGSSRLLAGLHLRQLKQPQALEVAFDGQTSMVFRLRPDSSRLLDDVTFRGEEAPVNFPLNSGDHITVGGYEVEALLTDEESLPLFDTIDRTDSTILSPSFEGAHRRLQRGRAGRLTQNSPG